MHNTIIFIYFKQAEIARHTKMINQIKDYLDLNGTVLDLGAGEGAMDRLMESIWPEVSVTDYDVVVSDPQSKTLTYDGFDLPLQSRYFDQSMAMVSLHHSIDMHSTVEEMVRVTKNRIILTESIPQSFFQTRKDDWNMAFIVDYMWRLYTGSREPVPGNYLKVSEWISLLASYGFELSYLDSHGRDQGMVLLPHVTMVFDRV